MCIALCSARGVLPPPEVAEALFSPDSQRLLVRFHGTIQIWDLKQGTPLWQSRVSVGSGPIEFSPDGTRFLCHKDNGQFSAWDTKTGLIELKMAGQNDGIGEARFLLDGGRILTCARDTRTGNARWSIWERNGKTPLVGPVSFWDVAQRGYLGRCYASLSKDGEDLAVLAFGTQTNIAFIQRWHTRDGSTNGSCQQIPLDRVYDQECLLSEGRLLVTGNQPMLSEDGFILGTQGHRLVRIIHINSPEATITQIGEEMDSERHLFDINGNDVLLYPNTGQVQVFDTKTMKTRGFLHAGAKPADQIRGAMWTHDGKQIVAWRAATDWTSLPHFALGDPLLYFDATTLDAIGEPAIPPTKKWTENNFQFEGALSPDGHRLCVTDPKGHIEVWQVPSYKLVFKSDF